MKTTQVGYVSDISTKSGTSANGNAWKMTRFRFSVLEFRKTDGQNVVRKYWVSTFNPIALEEGTYMLNLEILNRKSGRKNENGNDIYELALDVTAAERMEACSGQMQSSSEGIVDEDIPF